MPTDPTIHSKRVYTHSRIFTIEELDIEFSNGERRKYERVRGPRHGAVMMMPFLDDETILMIREYAAGIEQYELTLPKGAIAEAEEMLETANRELMEEVGYGAKQLEHIKTFSTSPGYLGGQIHLIHCRDLYAHKLEGDEPEPLEVVPCKISEIDEVIRRDDVTDARTIAALLMVKNGHIL